MIDLVGNRYGRLVVLQFAYNKQNTQNKNIHYWLCQCDCGKQKTISGNDLTRKNTYKATKSCGCGHGKGSTRPSKLKSGESSFNRIYYQYVMGAKRRGLSFELSKEFAKQIMSMDCYYCGVSPSNKSFGQRRKGEYVYSGIDRVDNTKGYIESNVVPCCGQCNKSKGKLEYKEFISWIKRITEFMEKRYFGT